MKNFTLAAFADEADHRLSGQIRALTAHDIPYLEIRHVDGESISAVTPEKARFIHDQLAANALAVWSIGSPFGKIRIDADFAPHLDAFRRGLETAHILGAAHMRIFSFYVPAADADRYADSVMERLERFCEAAKGSGITLCHENEKGIFGDVPARCAMIHKHFPEIKAVFDPANFIQCGPDTRTAWEQLAPYVEYMHVKDALADGTVVPAGKGLGNLPYLLEHYTGEVLTLEPHLAIFRGLNELEADEKSAIDSYRYASAEEAFSAAAGALKELLA